MAQTRHFGTTTLNASERHTEGGGPVGGLTDLRCGTGLVPGREDRPGGLFREGLGGLSGIRGRRGRPPGAFGGRFRLGRSGRGRFDRGLGGWRDWLDGTVATHRDHLFHTRIEDRREEK